MIEQIDKNSPEGAIFGQTSTAKIGFYGAIPQPLRGMPALGPVQAMGTGQICTFGTVLSPVSVAINTVAEQSLTVTGVLATDFIFAVNKVTNQAGLGIVNVRVSAANTLSVAFMNDTGTIITPTATQNYNIVAVRGINPNTVALSPASVAAASSVEQVFNVAPVTAVGTPIILNGQFVGANITTAGTYAVPPSVEIADSLNSATNPIVEQGGLTPPAGMGGRGAVGTAILNASGGVIGVNVSNPGSGYSAATATISFYGGAYIQPGMVVQVSKPTTQAGLGIGGCRVVDVNRIGITFVNPTAAAITPTAAESYSIMALPALPAIANIINVGVAATSVALVASITTTEQSITVNGLLATDYVVGATKPTTQAGLGLLNGRCAANAYLVTYLNTTQGNLTPTTTEVYGVGVLRQAATAPLVIYTPVLTPVSVAANTTAEQTFTVTGLVFSTLGSTVQVNKPTAQAGLSIVGARVTAANTLGITFANTSANAIVPTAGEQYTVGNFQMVNPSTANYNNWVYETVAPSHALLHAMANEMRQSLDNVGLAVQA